MFATTAKTSEIVANLRNIIRYVRFVCIVIQIFFVPNNIFRYLFTKIKSFNLFIYLFVTIVCLDRFSKKFEE